MSEHTSGWRLCRWDVALAVGAAVYEVRDVLLRGSGDRRYGEAWWPGIIVWAAMSALLLLRRRWPGPIAAVAIAADLASFYPAAEAVALFTVGAHTLSRRLQAGLLAASALGHTLAFWYDPDVTMPQLAPHYIIFSVTPMLLGLYVAARQRLRVSQEEQIRSMELERVLLEERARAQERREIGREMHDVVAHGVTHMVFRAGALQMAAESRQADWVAEEAVTLQSLGRGVLGELRTALGLVGGGNHGDRAPLPTAAGLPALLERTREGGVAVTLRQNHDLDSLEPVYGRTLYRIVQEALTNVSKHACGARAQVDVAYGPQSLTVRILNGPPSQPQGTARPADGSLPEGGQGLLGMRERVTLLGGTLTTGPTGDGGFRVEAIIPLTPRHQPARARPPRPGTGTEVE
ncbi:MULTISPECIES: histidine kinase [unclassified Streptomyces]|uniref:sensor histidine kinase n=1 Tax=unclassified Streptomyces TaxID=2593676 RepID=UPI000DC7D0BC|nr:MULTISPECIES: histidine kinase [unclassified Streptomyces]AWZ07979.1 hypothetical protein DRB89_29035 [Streptomyces sp. ICC4]AWZ15722.1 hypothetical protein DRB96_29605 [Streptomyces sp. ICC1]